MHGDMAAEFASVLGDQRSQPNVAGNEVNRRAGSMGWPPVDHTDGISK